ncbi:MAG: hypothetical protein RDU30_16385, partial [Desulfovibrionaceae bacterium]|nr:hypothetical protein [Desulfovibrionaceae bacterium]
NRYIDQVDSLPSEVLLSLAEALTSGNQPSSSLRALSQKLFISASQGRLEERELRRIAVALNRSHNYQDTLALIGRQLQLHPEWEHNASLLQLRGDSLLGLATNCRRTGKNKHLLPDTRKRAWRDFHNYIDRAERDLREALLVSSEKSFVQLIKRNLDYLEKLRRENRPPSSRKPQ